MLVKHPIFIPHRLAQMRGILANWVRQAGEIMLVNGGGVIRLSNPYATICKEPRFITDERG